MNDFPDVPSVVLQSPEGARAVIALHGANVLSWRPPGEGEALFLSRQSNYSGNAAIRGGVPIVFPQFSTRGPLQKHGFVRNLAWHCVGAEGDRARFALDSSDLDEGARRAWPHAHALQFEVRLEGDSLVMALQVRNTGQEAFSFHAALHTYLRVEDIRDTRLYGLQGLRYLEQAAAAHEGRQEGEAATFAVEIDRIYADAKHPLRLDDGKRQFDIAQTGFRDAVVWNPGVEKARAINDLEAGGVMHFVCVEAAAVMEEIVLGAGAQWQGEQRITRRR